MTIEQEFLFGDDDDDDDDEFPCLCESPRIEITQYPLSKYLKEGSGEVRLRFPSDETL